MVGIQTQRKKRGTRPSEVGEREQVGMGCRQPKYVLLNASYMPALCLALVMQRSGTQSDPYPEKPQVW